MINECVKFRGYLCFSKEWAGFDVIQPINIIIGKNNSGKTCLLDLLDQVITGKMSMADYRFSGILTESELKKKFRKDETRAILVGNLWHNHGKHFINKPVEWVMDRTGKVEDVHFIGEFNYKVSSSKRATEARLQIIEEILTKKRSSLFGRTFRRLVADRDIVPELPNNNMTLSENGVGATNIIKRFITSEKYPREPIQKDLLDALNKILGKDTEFTEIEVQEHDETADDQQKGKWEIFFGEKHKGLISLSRSGSGLKTIILVLLNLLVIPKIENSQPSSYVFAFEELENNLHPSALRRLLAFIEEFSLGHQCPIFLTTHSNVTLDFFSISEHAQIVHVVHNGEYAVSHTISAHFDLLNIISDLGAKPSDLLQANGIVWVEGPSDRIYFNKWIEIFSNGELHEGRDYQCAYFGGALLKHYQFAEPEKSEKELANLLNINPNAIIIADGDRTAAKGKVSEIKNRVKKIINQIKNLPNGYAWVTKAKEVENYIPVKVLEIIWNKSNLPKIGQYEFFCHNPKTNRDRKGYLQKHLGNKDFDKVELAIKVAQLVDRQMLSGMFDLEKEMREICELIKKWNNP